MGPFSFSFPTMELKSNLFLLYCISLLVISTGTQIVIHNVNYISHLSSREGASEQHEWLVQGHKMSCQISPNLAESGYFLRQDLLYPGSASLLCAGIPGMKSRAWFTQCWCPLRLTPPMNTALKSWSDRWTLLAQRQQMQPLHTSAANLK